MRTTIRESRNLAGRFRGGKLAPCMAVAVKGGEGGLLSQTATIELDPVAGRLVTPVTGELWMVYAPVQAMIALRDDTDDLAGVTEVIRQRYLDGTPLFGLEAEGELSKRMGVMPVSIGGVKQVSSAVRLAHNCAVNFLRQSLYTYAATVDKSNAAVTPALLSSTALMMFNGVLDPDRHVGGLVSLTLSGNANLSGLGLNTTGGPGATPGQVNSRQTGGVMSGNQAAWLASDTTPTASEANLVIAQDPANPGYPNFKVDLSQADGTGFTLNDLANAETMDRITRQMRSVIDANPVDGEEQIVRWAHGLRVDDAVVPFLLARRQVIFGQDLLKAMDGAGIEAETTQSRLAQRITVTVPVPTTELGGVIVTFLVVKPDETLYQQPHPVLSQVWAFDNLAAQELELDPVPVTARELQASVTQPDELKVMMYTGFNELRRTYVNYGWNRHVDPSTVDAKNALWQYEIPASVTPENILYPENLDHFPFVDQDAEVARYMLASTYVGKSPIFVGPSPVETVAVIDSDDLFEGADE